MSPARATSRLAFGMIVDRQSSRKMASTSAIDDSRFVGLDTMGKSGSAQHRYNLAVTMSRPGKAQHNYMPMMIHTAAPQDRVSGAPPVPVFGGSQAHRQY